MSGGIIDLTSLLMGGVSGLSQTTEGYSPLSYPVSIPPVSGVRSILWGREEVVARSESPFTLTGQVHHHPGQRWRVLVELPKMNRAAAGAWSSFLLTLSGGVGLVQFGDFFNPSPRGLAWGSPKVYGAGQRGNVLATYGWNENVTGILLAGDMIQVAGRLYQVIRDTNSDGNGLATLDIWPRINIAPPNNDMIITNAPRGLFSLAIPGGPLAARVISGAYEMPAFELIGE